MSIASYNPSGSIVNRNSPRPLPTDGRLSLSWRSFNLRERWILILLSLLLVLNRGFSSIVLPPGIPIPEATIVFFFTFVNWKVFLPRLFQKIPATPYLTWWSFGYASAIFYALTNGFWAFRDAGFVLDSVFLIIGILMARSEEHILFIFRWLRVTFVIATFYALTSPIGETLAGLIVVPGVHGNGSNVLGQYENSTILVVIAAVAVFTWSPRKALLRQLAPAFFAFIIAVVAAFYQARNFYVIVLVAGLVLLATYARQAWRLWIAPACFIVCLSVLSISGIELQGRLGSISLSFFLDHLTSFSGAATGEARGAANGVLQRYGWWQGCINQWLATRRTMLLGVGFGNPLIDFVDPLGNPVRDPHNSYLSILTRLGLVGAASWLWVTAHIVYSWTRAYKLSKTSRSKEMRSNLVVVLLYYIACWLGAYSEPVFEHSFNTIVYYFLSGVCIQYVALMSSRRERQDEAH
jgi:hypothetical protein